MFDMEKLIAAIDVLNRLIESIDKHTAALEKNTAAIKQATKPPEYGPM